MASTTQFGALCPEGHGVLIEREDWTREGVIWCSHSEHGGNGRFYRDQEVKTGTFNPAAPRVKSEWQIEQDIKAATQAAVREQLKESKVATKEPKPKAPRKAKEPIACKCGCGEMTKGGRFRPGHDARYHSALAKEQAAAALVKEQAEAEETF